MTRLDAVVFVSRIGRVVLAVLLMAVLGACASRRALDRESADPGHAYRIIKKQEHVFVDETRTTPAAEDCTELANRRLPARVTYPKTKSAERLPLVLFAHGYFGYRGQSGFLTRYLARQGFVVLAMNFPLTSFWSDCHSVADVPNQARDLQFLIDRVTELANHPTERWHEMVDPERVAVVGHSMGGLTAILASHGKGSRVDGIKAVVALAPACCFLSEADLDPNGPTVPSLIVGGDRDWILDYAGNTAYAYDLLPSPKFLITLVGGTHSGFTDFNFSDRFGLKYFIKHSGGMDAFVGDAQELSESLAGEIDRCGAFIDGATLERDWPRKTSDHRVLKQVTTSYALKFLDHYLKGDTTHRALFSDDWNTEHDVSGR